MNLRDRLVTYHREKYPTLAIRDIGFTSMLNNLAVEGFIHGCGEQEKKDILRAFELMDTVGFVTNNEP